MDAGIGAAGAHYGDGSAFDFRNGLLEGALDGGQAGLDLPAVELRSIVGQRNPDSTHGGAVRRAGSPASTTGNPCWHSGQSSGGQAVTWRVTSAARGAPTSAEPPLRSMMEPAASTRAPAACSNSTTSRVLPPVVTTSSITTTLSPGWTEKPRRRIIRPSVPRSVKMKRAPKARATSCPMIKPPTAGEATTFTLAAGKKRQYLAGEVAAQGLGVDGVLEHQGALQVLGAMQSAGEPEVPVEVGAGPFEEIQDAAFLRCHKSLLYH